jgi:filamentous hemagglutinin
VDTAQGQAASLIGANVSDYMAHKLAHALAGCVAGAAAGGACKDGAIGGAVGENVAQMFKGQVPSWTASDAEWDAFDAKVKASGKLVAGAVAAYAGGNAQTAITTAEVAIDNNSRIAYRIQAMQQGVSQQQFWLNTRVQSLRTAVQESGGSVPGNVTAPGARVDYSQNDVTQLEAQLRSLNPIHQLIHSVPSSTVSPMPASYVNMGTAVNMNNVPGASSTNAFGFPSGGNAYFRELMRTNPQMFSQRNSDFVSRGKNPEVDSTWIQYNPTHQSFSGETLVHHHWMQGNIAVAIPTTVHQQWYATFHPYR